MANDLNYLKKIEEALQQANFPTELLEASKTQLPLDVLSATIGTDYKERGIYFSFSFYPTENKSVTSNYMQIFCELPNSFSAEAETVYVLLVPYLNAKVPMGHMGFDFSSKKTYLRYTMIYDEQDPNQLEKVKEVVSMLAYTVDSIQASLKLVEEGVDNLNTILSEYEKVGQ